MKTGLGLSFWRVVNEEGVNGWAQVYARIPFDDLELKSKGALFGTVYGEDKNNWAERDTKLMAWVEEYFNKLESVGDLGDFGNEWRVKYPDLNGVWVWVSSEKGRRDLRIVCWGETKVVLTRNKKEFDFSKNLLPGKVVRGNIEKGDRLVVLVGKIKEEMLGNLAEMTEEDVLRWNKELQEEESATAGLVLNFRELPGEDGEVYPDSRVDDTRMVVQEEKKPIPDLAEDRLVGPIGWKEKLINRWLKFRPVEQKGLIERTNLPKRKKWSMLLWVLFLILLVVSLASGSIKMKRTTEQKKWQGFSEPIEKGLLEAGSLVSINPTGAKKLIEDIKASFNTGKSQFTTGRYSKDLSILEKKINDSWTAASGEKESQLEDILRIDLVRQGFKGDRLDLQKDNQFLILDTAMGVIVTGETKAKDIKVVAGKGEGLGWADVSGEGTKIVVLNSGGIRNAVTGTDLVKFDSAVARPVTMGSFGGNLYVLDQGNKEVYKYAAVGDGFGDRTRWLKQGQSILAEPVDMAMDADVWVTSENGQVERFRRGSKEQFSLTGLPSNIKVRRLAVERDGNKLALLDKNNGMIVVCSKGNGVCNQVLKSSKLLEASDVEFDGQGNLMVLVGGIVGVMK